MLRTFKVILVFLFAQPLFLTGSLFAWAVDENRKRIVIVIDIEVKDFIVLLLVPGVRLRLPILGIRTCFNFRQTKKGGLHGVSRPARKVTGEHKAPARNPPEVSQSIKKRSMTQALARLTVIPAAKPGHGFCHD